MSRNLIQLAQGTDYLVHEVIDPAFVDRLVATLPAEIAPAVRQHLIIAHTTIEQVGRDVAEPAGAKNLVLTHLVPGRNPRGVWQQAGRGYSGRLIVGEDLMELEVGESSRSGTSSSLLPLRIVTGGHGRQTRGEGRRRRPAERSGAQGPPAASPRTARQHRPVRASSTSVRAT